MHGGQVDQLAAETLADEDDRIEDDAAVEALLDEAERDSGDADAGGAAAGDNVHASMAAPERQVLSPRSELQGEVVRLKKSLQKKTAQVEQLVASQRQLLKSKSQREEELNEQATQLRQEIDKVAVQRKLVDQGRKHAEQQVETMKQSVKSKSEDLGRALAQIETLQGERDAALQRLSAMEATHRQHEDLMSDLQAKHEQALSQVGVARRRWGRRTRESAGGEGRGRALGEKDEGEIVSLCAWLCARAAAASIPCFLHSLLPSFRAAAASRGAS